MPNNITTDPIKRKELLQDLCKELNNAVNDFEELVVNGPPSGIADVPLTAGLAATMAVMDLMTTVAIKKMGIPSMDLIRAKMMACEELAKNAGMQVRFVGGIIKKEGE